MKNFTSKVWMGMLFLFISTAGFAQLKMNQSQYKQVFDGQTKSSPQGQVAKKPLLEEFTSSTCGPCVGANIIIGNVLNANPDAYTLIKYQMNWPGTGDPYYTAEGGVRRSYYGVDGAPDLYINSTRINPPSNFNQGVFDLHAAELTSLEINIGIAAIDDDNVITIEAEIYPLANYAAGLKAHIVVIEKLTTGNVGSNGETEFHNVMMKMLPDASGTTLEALAAGVPVILSQSYDMNLTFMETPNDLAVVIFIQDESDKTVHQSAMANVAASFNGYNTTFTVNNEMNAPVEGAVIFMQDNGSKTTNAMGQAVFVGVYPGSYAYDVEAPGYFPVSGSVSVVDQDVSEAVIMEAPDYYWYEMFDTGIPDDFTVHVTAPDFLYWYQGEVIFFKQSFDDNPIMLVTPMIDITPANMIYFDAGKHQSSPDMVFGTVTDPNDPTTFTALETYNPGEEMLTYEYDLTSLEGGNVYFAWKLVGEIMPYFSLDNIIITAGTTSSNNIIVKDKINIYPNPAADIVNISSEEQINSVQVFNYSGSLVNNTLIKNNTGQIKTHQFATGLYIFRIQTASGVTTQQVVIQ